MGEWAQPTRLLLIRHAKHDPRGRLLQQVGEGLTAIGVARARLLAARLAADPGLTSAVVLASNSLRAIGTAEILDEALGTPVAVLTRSRSYVRPRPAADAAIGAAARMAAEQVRAT